MDEAIDIKKYIKHKLKLLKELFIFLNKEELEHIYSLESEIAIDNFVRDIIKNKEWRGNLYG